MLSRPRHLGSVSGIMLPDIAQAGRTQKRIGDGMANHVRVGMSHQSQPMLDHESTEDQRSPFAQPVRVMPDPNPHVVAPSSESEHDPGRRPHNQPARIVSFCSLCDHPKARFGGPFPLEGGFAVILRRKVSRSATRSHSYP